MTTKAASHFHQQSCGPEGGWGAEVPGHFGVEKKVIMDAIGPSLRNPASAKYRWAKFPAVVTEDSVNYCATVDAQSPYAAFPNADYGWMTDLSPRKHS
jgi:hypothetical protein